MKNIIYFKYIGLLIRPLNSNTTVVISFKARPLVFKYSDYMSAYAYFFLNNYTLDVFIVK